MISFASLKYGIIILLITSKPSHSTDIDLKTIEKIILSMSEEIRAEIILLQTEIKEVKTTVNTLEIKLKNSRIEDELISIRNEIRNENKKLQKNLKEVKTSVKSENNRIEVELISIRNEIKSENEELQNNLKDVKTSVKSDSMRIEENLIFSMKDIISSENDGLKKNLNEVNSLVNTLSVTLDVLMTNQDAVQSKSEKAFMKLEEKFTKDISNAAKFISQKDSLNKDLLLMNQNAVLSKSEISFMKLEERLIEDISKAAKQISLEVSLNKDFLMKNQDAVYSKSEKAHLKLVEKVIKYISEAETNILLSISSCKEKPFGNNNHSNVTVNFGPNISGRENSCTSFTEHLLAVANSLLDTNVLTHSPVRNCLNGLFKNINGLKYQKGSYLQGKEIISYCKNQGGKPFVPRTKDEFLYNIVMAIIHTYFWYPINDVKKEGRVVLYDGTDYGNSIYKPEKWFQFYPNKNDRDCAAMNIFGEVVWHNCDAVKHRVFCQLK